MSVGSMRVGRVVVRRLLQVVPTTLGVVVLSFLLIKLAPGDAADVLVAESGFATQETTAQLRKHLGLDVPALSQLLNYLGNLAHLNLGVSPRYNVPVIDLISERIGNTVTLMLSSLSFALLVGVAFGTLMASYHRRWPDRAPPRGGTPGISALRMTRVGVRANASSLICGNAIGCCSLATGTSINT